MNRRNSILLIAMSVCIFLCADILFFDEVYAASSASVRSLTFTKKSYSIRHKNKKAVKVIARDKNGRKIKVGSIKYSTSNKKVVKISRKGVVRAVGRGKCRIYAKAGKKKASATVYVNANPRLNAADIPVLTYHRVVSDKVKALPEYKDYRWYAALSDFKKQMKYIHDKGYRTISMDEFYSWYTGEATLPENSVLITIDDGFYETYHLMYPVFRKYGLKATAFIVGSMTEDTTHPYEDSPDDYRIGYDKVQEVRNDYPDLEFQSHSYDLHHKIDGEHAIKFKTYEECVEDIENNRRFGFSYFAWPYGRMSEPMIQALEESDIKLAFGFVTKGYARKTDYKWEIYRLRVDGQLSYRKYKKMLDRYYS